MILDQQNLLTMIGDERFYSSIVQVKISNGTQQEAIVKDVQMHPARNVVVHVDLQRVIENEPIRIKLPIHFKGESISPGVKVQGGVVSHMRADVEVVTLPKDLPEFLELDMSGMSLNDTKFLSDIPLPAGRHDSRARTSQRAGGVDPQPARRRSRSRLQKPLLPHPPRAQPLLRAPLLRRCGDAKKGDAKAEAAPAKKEGGKK